MTWNGVLMVIKLILMDNTGVILLAVMYPSIREFRASYKFTLALSSEFS